METKTTNYQGGGGGARQRGRDSSTPTVTNSLTFSSFSTSSNPSTKKFFSPVTILVNAIVSSSSFVWSSANLVAAAILRKTPVMEGEGGAGRRKRRDEAAWGNAGDWKKWAIGLSLLALTIGGCLQVVLNIYDLVFGGFKAVDITDAVKIKDVMFGGNPYLVYCSYPGTPASKVHPVLEKSRSGLPSDIRLARLDCSGTLPSGKTFFQRFSLPTNAVGFVVANANRPVALTQAALNTPKSIIEFVKKHSAPSVPSVTNANELKRLCLGYDRCIIFGQKGGMSSQLRNVNFPELMKSTRTVKVVNVDTKKCKLKLDDKILMTRGSDNKNGSSRQAIEAICVGAIFSTNNMGSSKDKSWGIRYIGRFYGGNVLNFSGVALFMKQCLEAQEGLNGFVALDSPPQISLRPNVVKTEPFPSSTSSPSPSAHNSKSASSSSDSSSRSSDDGDDRQDEDDNVEEIKM